MRLLSSTSGLKRRYHELWGMGWRKLPIGNLPKHVDEYVLTWMSDCPEHAKKILWRYPLSRLALRRIARPTDWSMADQAPELIFAGKI